jgi:hypothetical protein
LIICDLLMVLCSLYVNMLIWWCKISDN